MTECGTDRGYYAHRRRREPTCVACKAAHAAARTKAPAMPTLPVEPLIEAYNRAGYSTIRQISRTTGIYHQRLHTAVDKGRIDLWVGDRLAIHLNSHPLLIWGDEWFDQEQAS